MKAPVRRSIPRSPLKTRILALCLVSSACDLVFEIVWGRALGLIFGVTVFAVSAVLAAFMLGLTIGSLGVRRLLRSTSPLALFARLHIAVAVTASSTLLALPAIQAFYVGASHRLGEGSALRPSLFVLTFLVLVVPTTLIGAIFPVAAQLLAPGDDRVGRDIGALYAVGTVGSILGCIAAVAVLLPVVGLRFTLLVTALVDLAIGLAATKLAPAAASPASVPVGAVSPVFLALAGCLGAQTLAYEVLCTRILTYFVDTSVYSFALMLAVFLAGLSAGSALVGTRLDASRDPKLLFARIEIGIGLSSVVAIPLLAHTGGLVAAIDVHVGATWGSGAAGRFGAFSLALLVPTALMGAAFPVLVKAAAAGAPLDRALPRIYGFNTAGGAVGSLAAGFVLVPWLGVQNGVVAVGALGVAVGVAVLTMSSAPADRVRVKARWASFAAVVALVVVSVSIPRDAFEAVYRARYPAPTNELLYLRENINGTAAVFRDVRREGGTDRRYLVIDGRGEVSTDYFSMRAFRFLGILPALYAPRIERALIVTFGSGIVAGTIAGLTGMKSADCVEICKDALGAASFFAEENHNVANDPKVSFLIDDGRNFLLTTENRYDILSADATHPTSRDSWILYTQEFYALAAARLNDGGVMSQWLPMHGVSERDFKTLLKTFHSAFPFVAVYYSGGFKAVGHLVLVGSKSPLRIDVHRAEDLFANERVRGDLVRVNVASLPDLFAGFLFDESAIDSFAGDAPLNTDDRPIIAFALPAAERTPSSWLSSLAKARMRIYPQLSGMDSGTEAGIAAGLATAFEATGLALDAEIREAKEFAARSALDLDHSDASTQLGLERSLAELNEVVATYERALQINPSDTQTRYLRARAAAEVRSLQGILRRAPEREGAK